MKYHKKEKIYCLSEKDQDDLLRSGKNLWFDAELNNYYWILETVSETEPNFFEVKEEDWLKVVDLGYTGENDVREILDWFEFEYHISYTRSFYEGSMISGFPNDLLEAKIIIDRSLLFSFLSINVKNKDERSKYVLMKRVVESILLFFEMKGGKVYGPSAHIFEKQLKGNAEWT